jgi:transposase-like protein
MRYLRSSRGFIGSLSDYSEEKAIEICERYAAGETVAQICKSEEMPSRDTLYTWLRRHPDFAMLFRMAREELLEKLGKEILEIADDTKEAADVPVARLRIESRKYLLHLHLARLAMRDRDREQAAPMTVTINLDNEE